MEEAGFIVFIKPAKIIMSQIDNKSVNSMLNDSISFVKRETISKHLVNAPSNPCIIIYLTEKSASFHENISDGLHKYWGNRVEYIPQLLYKDDKFYSCNSQEEIDIYEIIENIRSFKENIFEDKKCIKLYFYLDTYDINGVDNFTTLYNCVDFFKEIRQVNFLTMLFYVEDSSIKPQRVSLREQFAEMIIDESNSEKYNSVFWLSTNLYGGDVLKDDRETENYLLSTSLIFLSNNNDNEGVSYRENKMFSKYPNSSAFTVSYINLCKPIKAIVANTYVSILNFLMNEMFVVDKKLILEETDILSALRIGTNVDNSLSNQIYERIVAKIPKIIDLRSLPNITNQPISITRRDGVDFNFITDYLNKVTLDCWTDFYNYNYIRIINELLESDYSDSNIKDAIVTSLLNKFSYIELSQLLESKAIKAVEEYSPAALTARSINSLKELDSFIKNQIKNDIFNLLKPLYKIVIREVDALSEQYIENLEALEVNVQEQAKIKNDDLSGNIASYYDNIVRTYMHSSDNIQRINGDFKNYHENMDEVYSRLSSLFSRIIESYPIYKSSFEEELNARLSSVNAGQANQLIAKALQNPIKIKDQIRINSSSEPYVLNTYYLVNGNSDYVNILDADKNSVINTGVSNSAETIVLYSCSKENIILR